MLRRKVYRRPTVKMLFSCIAAVVLLILAGGAAAVSPMPQEIHEGAEKKPSETLGSVQPSTKIENGCSVNIISFQNAAKGQPYREDSFSSLIFESSVTRKEMIEDIMRYITNKLSKEGVSEFRIECKLPKSD